jgi:glycosyltransferase involved in cell wall biosynthesis
MTELRVALVVPCYIEAARLAPATFLAFLPPRPWLTLLFVDDGSHDGTVGMLESIEAACAGQVRVLRLAHAGKAEAVRAGVVEAAGWQPDYIGFWDADLSTPLEALDDFVALARRRPDVDLLLGSRVNLMGRENQRSSARHYVSRIFATAASIALDLPVYDTQCGAKVLRVNEATATLFAEPFRSPWIFDVELIARYLRLSAGPGEPPRRDRLYELVVPAWHDVPGSKLRWHDFARAAVELAHIWRERVAQRPQDRTAAAVVPSLPSAARPRRPVSRPRSGPRRPQLPIQCRRPS